MQQGGASIRLEEEEEERVLKLREQDIKRTRTNIH